MKLINLCLKNTHNLDGGEMLNQFCKQTGNDIGLLGYKTKSNPTRPDLDSSNIFAVHQ